MGGNSISTAWYGWTAAAYSTVTACANDTSVWRCWTNSSTSNSSEWETWTDHYEGVTGSPVSPPSPTWQPPPPPSPEEIARREADEQRRRKERREAAKRAVELLREYLSPEQLREINGNGVFTVISSTGKRFEVDTKKSMHNVFELDEDGKRIVEHCIYATGDVPLADNALAQTLLLQTDEERFRRIANQRTLAA